MALAFFAAGGEEQHALLLSTLAGSRFRSAWRLAVGTSAALAILSFSAWMGTPTCAGRPCRSTSHNLEATILLKQSGSNATPILGLKGGLGFDQCTGLVNQLLILFGAVMYAHEQGIRYISADSLKFHSGWDSDQNNVKIGDLFNLTHWNARAMGNQSLPLPFIVPSGHVTHWIKAKDGHFFQHGSEQADVWTAKNDPSVCWFWGSLRPVDALLKAVESAKPVGQYGVFHARIENDLNTTGIPAIFRQDRLSLPTMYDMIANFSHPCVRRPDSFYMCVMASDVTVPEDAALLKRRLTPWENLSLELGGVEAVRRAGLKGSKVQGAILDFEVARRGKFFIGEEGLSTFAMAIATSRACAGLQCNIHLGPDGIRNLQDRSDLQDLTM